MAAERVKVAEKSSLVRASLATALPPGSPAPPPSPPPAAAAPKHRAKARGPPRADAVTVPTSGRRVSSAGHQPRSASPACGPDHAPLPVAPSAGNGALPTPAGDGWLTAGGSGRDDSTVAFRVGWA
eukprot:scaffold10356_cov118-Isochrysis_galbana.AAC.9